MPVLRRSQSTLDFPVQKTTRTRSAKKLLEPIEVQPQRKRRTITSENFELDCSPLKRSRVPGSTRSSSRRKNTAPDPEPQIPDPVLIPTPTPPQNTPKKSLLQNANSPKPRPKYRVSFAPTDEPPAPLSPRRDFKNSPTPNTQGTPIKSPLRVAFYSPSIRALDFSPSRPKIRTPTKTDFSRLTPTKRTLDFSPRKEMRMPPPPSPSRRSLGFSPMKEARLGGGGCGSPSRHSIAIMQSPRKFGLLSPRKLDQPPLSPRKLDVRSLNSPLRLAKQEGICYQRAKQALHTALPDRIVCREREHNVVNGFLETHISRKTSGSLYISGAPGTGKTAVLSKIMQDLHQREDCQTVYVNCMNFKNSQAIFNKVQSELEGREVTLATKQAIRKLEKALCKKGTPIVLILDEVDQLDSKNQDVLYTMFEWPTLDNSRLVLIGIANALDFTDRVLPRLQARPNCRPELLNFEPYTKDQIVAVLKDRLNQVSLEGHVVLDPSAIQFCARKVAAVAGDMRRALDVCRRAVEMVEGDVRKQQVIQPITSLSACYSPSKMPPVPKKITVAHVMKTLNEVYGSNVTSSNGQPQTIPIQQKLAVCSLLLLVKHGKAKVVTLGKLHETYQKVCSQQQVAAASQSEFHSMCSLIEAKGILSMKKAKEARLAKVTLKLDENELQQALQDKVLMSTILQNGLPK